VRKEDRIAVVLLALLLTLVFSDVLFSGQNFFFRDLTRFYYPAKKQIHDLVRAGSFPWWNPAVSAGQPLAANPEYELFYPPQWLIFLPDFDLGYRLHILVHFYIAALGMYVLLRSGRLRVESALFGSIAFTLGGLFLSSVNLLPYLFSSSWLPWTAFFAHRWMAGHRVRDLAGGGVALALQFLAGEPVTAGMTALLLVVFTLYIHRRPDSVIRLAIMAAAAVAVAAVLVIPGFDFARDTVRARPFPFDLTATWSAPPMKFIELILPDALGSGSQHCRLYWGTAMEGWRDPFYISIYFGLLPLALVIGALCAGVRGAWIVLAVSLVAGILAVGRHTPLLQVLYDARIFSSLRYPEKFVALGVIPLTIFSAVALDRAVGGDRRVIRAALVMSALVGCCAFVLLIASRMPGYAPAFVRFFGIEVHPLAAEMARISSRVWLFDFLRAAATCALLLLAWKTEIRWGWLAVLLLALDLTVRRPAIAETAEGSLLAAPPRAAAALAASGSRLFHQAEWYAGVPTARRYYDLPEEYWGLRNGLFPRVGEGWGVRTVLQPDYDATNLVATDMLVKTMWKVRDRGRKDWVEIFCAMSNAGWRALYRPFDQAVAAAGADRRSIEPIVFVPVKTNPRFYFADQVVQCGDDRQFVDLLATGTWSRRAVFLDGPPRVPATGTVLSSDETPNRIALRVRSAGRALLVCSITGDKYWKATLDGAPVPILTANLAYQALDVPAGEHAIVLTYRNPLIVWCGAVSLLALLSLLAAAAYDARRDRSERRPG